MTEPEHTCLNCQDRDTPGDKIPCLVCGLAKEQWKARAI